jgi:hypothetical protein
MIERHHTNMTTKIFSDPEIFPFPLPIIVGYSLKDSFLKNSLVNNSATASTRLRSFPNYFYSNYFIT